MEENSNHSFGHLFRTVRDQAGRQLSDVAAELHINVAHLEALENEQFDQLPSHSFARGYIRAYARALETDAEPLLRAYQRAAPMGDEWEAKLPLETENAPSRWPLMLMTAAIAATLVALFVIWFLGSGYSEKDPTLLDQEAAALDQEAADVSSVGEPEVTAEPESSTPLAETGPAAVGDQVSEKDAESEAEEEGKEAATSVSVNEASTAKVSGTASVETAVVEDEASNGQSAPGVGDKSESGSDNAAGKGKSDADQEEKKVVVGQRNPANPDLIRADKGDDRIDISLKDKSWVDVRDANGVRLLRGLYLEGAHKALIGQAPFQVFLGNAPAVELKAGGKPFDLSGFIRSNNTARFAVLNQTSSKE